MKRILLLMLVLPGAALAEEAGWDFRKGTVYTYESETILEWSLTVPPAPNGRPRTAKQRQEEYVTLRLEVLSIDEMDCELTGRWREGISCPGRR